MVSHPQRQISDTEKYYALKKDYAALEQRCKDLEESVQEWRRGWRMELARGDHAEERIKELEAEVFGKASDATVAIPSDIEKYYTLQESYEELKKSYLDLCRRYLELEDRRTVE